MYYNTPLSDIMTKDLVTVGPNDSLEIVDHLFTHNDFRHLPVVNSDGKILGVVSKSDYLLLCDSMTIFRKEVQREKNIGFLKTVLVEEVMSKQVAKLRPEDKVSVAAGMFKENLFHAIPIVTPDDELVGIVTTIDLINYAYDQPALNFK